MTDEPELKPYQFTIRGLLLLPLGVVAVGATWHWFGPWWGIIVGATCVGGLVSWACYSRTGRLIHVVIVYGGIFVLLLVLLLPALRGPRGDGRRYPPNRPARTDCGEGILTAENAEDAGEGKKRKKGQDFQD